MPQVVPRYMPPAAPNVPRRASRGRQRRECRLRRPPPGAVPVVDAVRPELGCLVVGDVQADDPNPRCAPAIARYRPLSPAIAWYRPVPVDAGYRLLLPDPEERHHLVYDLPAEAHGFPVARTGKFAVRAQQ